MIERWRRLAFGILLLGIVGTALELVLMGHYEDVWQWTPLALLGAGLISGGWIAFRPSTGAIRGFQGLMAVYLVSSGLGIYFHLKANVEFEVELRPSIAGLELIRETLTGAMPALAPGAMALLGLLGLLVCLGHPSLTRTGRDGSRPGTGRAGAPGAG